MSYYTSPNFSSQGQADQAGAGLGGDYGYGNIVLCWNKERFQIPLPPPSTTLSRFRSLIYDYTGVLPAHQKLIYSGAVLKDENAPLSAYQIYDDGSDDSLPWNLSAWGFGGLRKKEKRITLIGNVGERVQDRPDLRRAKEEEGKMKKGEESKDKEGGVKNENLNPTSSNTSSMSASGGGGGVGGEEETKSKIRKVLTDSVSTLDVKLEELEKEVSSGLEEGPHVIGKGPTRMQRALYLGETLLQALIKLDAVVIPMEFVEAKKERKEAVKKVQGLLDRVDGLKEKLGKAKSL